jgi:hypothetical protein
MNDKTQSSTRKDGFGTQGIGEDGDGSIGQAGSSAGGTGATSDGGGQRGARKVEGATGREDGSPALCVDCDGRALVFGEDDVPSHKVAHEHSMSDPWLPDRTGDT